MNSPAQFSALEEQRYLDAKDASLIGHFGSWKYTDYRYPYAAPDVVCVGAQKSGTTWLYSNLILNPHIFLPAIKEIQYFAEVHVSSMTEANVSRQRQTVQLKAYFDSNPVMSKQKKIL